MVDERLALQFAILHSAAGRKKCGVLNTLVWKVPHFLFVCCLLYERAEPGIYSDFNNPQILDTKKKFGTQINDIFIKTRVFDTNMVCAVY